MRSFFQIQDGGSGQPLLFEKDKPASQEQLETDMNQFGLQIDIISTTLGAHYYLR